MNEDAIIRYITGTFEGTETLTVTDNTFFFYHQERKFPFVTLMTNDDNDQASNLSRPAVFRLNIGISKQTYRSLFGPTAPISEADESVNSDYDFTALDKLMPHPVYGRMYWVCVLNPSVATFQEVIQPLLAEAYEMAVSKYTKHADRK